MSPNTCYPCIKSIHEEGGKFEELDVLRVITRKTSNSSINSPPQEVYRPET
jgi:hypothetical protein